MKVLIVSYYFPPNNVIAALRLGKIAKYLSECGWEPSVLTVQAGLFSSAGDLPVEIPEDRVVRAGLGKWATAKAMERQAARLSSNVHADFSTANVELPLRTLRWKERLWRLLSAQFSDVRFPDRALPWVLPAIHKGSDLLRDERFDAIFSSHGPPSSHIVASVLAKRFHLPWVADYRDLWSQNDILCRSAPFQWLETQLEIRTMKRACEMTTVSSPLAGQLEQLHGKPVTVIRNGFDDDDYRGLESKDRKATFTIVYTGMVYPGKHDPSIIFQAVRQLIDTGQFADDEIEVHFYGSDQRLVMDLARKSGVERNIRVEPRIPYHQSIRRQIEADLLLLLVWNDPQVKGVYSGKVFEYLGARRPILATGPAGGVIEALLRETQRGDLVSDVGAAIHAIVYWVAMKRSAGSTLFMADTDQLRPYTRRWQARQLAGVLDRVVKFRSASR